MSCGSKSSTRAVRFQHADRAVIAQARGDAPLLELEGRRQDLREQVVDLAGQEIMTADKVTLPERGRDLQGRRCAEGRQHGRGIPSGPLPRGAARAAGVIGTRELDTLLSDKDAVARELDGIVNGVLYAHAPARALSRVVALRLHLDDSLAANGPYDDEARDRLLAVVHEDLRRRAAGHLRGHRRGHTLRPSDLVHESYLRLCGQHAQWENREQFFGVASQLMRRILVDHARARVAAKRGGGLRVTLAEGHGASTAAEADLLDLDTALNELAALDERQARRRVALLRWSHLR